MIYDLIVRSQKGDNIAILELIEKFNPLLKKYSFKLHYEDSYNDLLLDLLESISNIQLNCLKSINEKIIISYIFKIIHNSYTKKISVSKKLQNLVPYSALSDSELYYVEAALATHDMYYKFGCLLLGIDQILTKSELRIFKMIYLLGFTASETALIYGISRQAVSKTRKRALLKLERWLK